MTANILVTTPYRPFTMLNKFSAVFNGEVWCGLVDKDPILPENQIQVYLVNEDGSLTPVSQPIDTNSAGLLVYNGLPAKFVTKSNHSLLVRDSLKAIVFYEPDMAIADPNSLISTLASCSGSEMIGTRSKIANAVCMTVRDKLNLSVDAADFGVKYDGTDESSALELALNSSVNMPITLNISGKVITSRPITIDLKSGSLFISGSGSVLCSAQASSPSNNGCLWFTGAKGSSISIKGISVESSLQKVRTTLNAIYASGISIVEISGASASKAGNCGIEVRGADYLSAKNNTLRDNVYAGIIFSGCKSVQVSGNLISDTGVTNPPTAPLYGYGISSSTRTDPALGNKCISIFGNTILNSCRKAIDVHDGVGVSIYGNTINGYGNGGIYAVSESDIKNVDDVSIFGNSVTQSKKFIDSIGITSFTTITAINVGVLKESSSSATAITEPSFSVTGNTLNDNDITGSVLSDNFGIMITTDADIAIRSISISSNIIKSSSNYSDIYSPPVGQIRNLSVNGNILSSRIKRFSKAISVPNALSISVCSNVVSGGGVGAVLATSSQSGAVSGNSFNGDYGNPNSIISISGLTIATSNSNNLTTIPDVSSNPVFQSGLMSSMTRSAQYRTGAEPSTVTILSCPTSDSESVCIYVKVIQSSYGVNGKAVWHGMAYKSSAGSVGISAMAPIFSAESAQPISAFWSGNNLRLQLNKEYTSYLVITEVSGFDSKPVAI